MLLGPMVQVAKQLARQQGIATKGYRVVINCGPQGGQVVLHLHMHLLGGRNFREGCVKLLCRFACYSCLTERNVRLS